VSSGVTNDEKQLRSELREVAKRGLDDPALLIDLDGLLQLPAVSGTQHLARSQNESITIQRCITLTSALTTVLSGLSQPQDMRAPSTDGSPSRTEVIDGLFMLSDEWKGLNITTRREKLARVEPEQDTSSFRRRIEEPLYDLVLSHLRHWVSNAETSPQLQPPVDDSQIDVEMLGNAVYRALLAAQAIANPERSDPINWPQGGEDDYWALEMLLVAYEATDDCIGMRPMPADRDTIPHDEYNSWYQIIGRIDSIFPPNSELLPFTKRELSSCLSEFKKGVGPFRDYLDDHPRGNAILQRWRTWLNWSVPSENIVSLMTCCTEAGQELLTYFPLSPDQRLQLEEHQSRVVSYLIDAA